MKLQRGFSDLSIIGWNLTTLNAATLYDISGPKLFIYFLNRLNCQSLQADIRRRERVLA